MIQTGGVFYFQMSDSDILFLSEVEVALGAGYTVTCLVDGGLPPHQVQIVTPDQGKLF